MVKRTASEANVDDECLMAIHCNSSMITDSMHTSDDRMMESPVPPMWRHEYSVEPVARVRAIPKFKLPLDVEDRVHSKGQSQNTNANLSNQGDDEDGEMDEVSALNTVFTPIVAPVARRVVSPELIFQSAAESLMRNRQRSADHGFRPIVADRPDLEITSPPLRAANPVIMDSRFQSMQRLDLTKDASVAPLQPFRPRPYRRFQSASPFDSPSV